MEANKPGKSFECTVAQYANAKGFSTTHVYRLIKNKAIKTKKIGKITIVICNEPIE